MFLDKKELKSLAQLDFICYNEFTHKNTTFQKRYLDKMGSR